MALPSLKTTELTYQEACEFFEYKENQQEFRNKVNVFEKSLSEFCEKTNQGINFPSLKGETEGVVTHAFADGQYIRTIVMPKGLTLVSKIHNKNHPFFIMKGECSIYTEKGLEKIKAPYHGITKAGTQRLMHIHEECTFITVHRTDCLTPEEVLNEVTVKDFSQVSKKVDLKQIDKVLEKFEVSS